jgi:hypothetical protein
VLIIPIRSVALSRFKCFTKASCLTLLAREGPRESVSYHVFGSYPVDLIVAGLYFLTEPVAVYIHVLRRGVEVAAGLAE